MQKELNFQLRHALTSDLKKVLEKVKDALKVSQDVLEEQDLHSNYNVITGADI